MGVRMGETAAVAAVSPSSSPTVSLDACRNWLYAQATEKSSKRGISNVTNRRVFAVPMYPNVCVQRIGMHLLMPETKV